jgi:aryl-alcohol dehydrogenase-like predicted oxidoreductase
MRLIFLTVVEIGLQYVCKLKGLWMEYRILGSTGLKVSELCLGTMQFGWTADEKTSYDVLAAAVEAGINFIDTADIYSRWAEGNPGGVAETILGKWLQNGVVQRHQMVIATKVRGRMGDGPNDEGLSRRHVLNAVQESLRRLQTEYIDLYQLHWPDEDTPIEETLRALDDLVRDGRVRYIGCSNFSAWRLMQALWVSERNNLARFICLQPHYNLIHRQEYERELESVCQTYDLGVIPYSPLAGGFLTGKYERGVTPPTESRGSTSKRIQTYMQDDRAWETLAKLRTLAEAQGKTVSQMALAWQLTRPSVTSPIIGPRSLEQLNDNLGAAGLRLSPDQMEELEQISQEL